MNKLKIAAYCLLSLPPFLLAGLALSMFSPLRSGGLTVGLVLGLALLGCASPVPEPHPSGGTSDLG